VIEMKRTLTIALAVAATAAGCGSHAAGHPAAAKTPARLALRLQPYLGVSCRQANSIACDRVRLAVWLPTRPRSLSATIDGHTFPLRPPASRQGYWEGALRPAGMLSPGAELRVTPDRGRFYWQGRHPVRAAVHLAATLATGAPATADVVIDLRAGYG
jgi:hypothetical protein